MTQQINHPVNEWVAAGWPAARGFHHHGSNSLSLIALRKIESCLSTLQVTARRLLPHLHGM
jgi:hypothetical protein